MHVLFATAEIAPFHATDGAAMCETWTASLAGYRPDLDAEVQRPNPIGDISIITPLYGFIDRDAYGLAKRLTPLTVELDGKKHNVNVYEGRTEGRVRVFFVDHKLFGRKYVFGPPNKPAYKDNAKRFGFFSRCVMEFCKATPLTIDIVHCVDWPTALVPVYLDAYYREQPSLEQTMTCLSIQDLSDQGVFDAEVFDELGLPRTYFEDDALEHDGKVNILKGGILFGDVIATPSPTYTDEIMEEPDGLGLAKVLDYRGEDVFGVLEGIDYDAFDPATDDIISVKYNLEHLNGKRRNKAELQHIYGLPIRPLVPLIGLMSPLQKEGTAALIETLEQLLEDGRALQFVVLSDGDKDAKAALVEFQERRPKVVGLHFGSDARLARHLLAGLDMLVSPRRTAAFDATSIQGLRYGTVSIAPDTGSYTDSLVEWNGTIPTRHERAAGFLFGLDEEDGLKDAIVRALDIYSDPRNWRPMVESCMKTDFGWGQTAIATLELYHELLGEEW